MIDHKQYQKIVDLMPIICVDMCIEKDEKYLLVKRKNQPLKGEWWVPGGRMLKGETAFDCLVRKLKEETGLEFNNLVESRIFWGFYENVFDKSPFGCPVHTISLVYWIDYNSLGGEIKLDDQSSDYKFGDLPIDFEKNIKKT